MNIHGTIDVFGTTCARMTDEELTKKFIELAMADSEVDVEKTSKINKVCDEIIERFVIENAIKNLDMDEEILDSFVCESSMSIDYYKLKSGKCLAVDTRTSNGVTMKAWYCDNAGVSTDEPAFKIEEVCVPVSINENGDALQYEVVGFNIRN